jgi:hypothetical protein
MDWGTGCFQEDHLADMNSLSKQITHVFIPSSERTAVPKPTSQNAVASEMRPYPALRARDKWHAMELRIVTNRGKKTCAPGNRTNYTEELMFALR